MGYSSYSSDASDRIKKIYRSVTFASTDSVFTSNVKGVAPPDLLPTNLTVRECRDSVNHPNSQGVMVMLDVTGSMGVVPEYLVRNKFDKLMEIMLANGQPDAAVLFGAIGDIEADKCPLQVGQFESGAEELIKCLTSTYLEGGGGGQNMESYSLAHLVAARYTALDCLEKRGKKGFLFTVGDESNWPTLGGKNLKALFGKGQFETLKDTEILAEAQRMYEVFHIHINESRSYRNSPEVLGYWKKLLGERFIICEDHTQVAEIIGSTVAVINGANLDNVVRDFDTATATAVKTALAKVNAGITGNTTGILAL